MASEADRSTNQADQQRLRRIDEIVEACRLRWAAGEAIDEERIIAAHPDLMPQLGECLRAIRLSILADRSTVAAAARDGVDASGVSPPARDAKRMPDDHGQRIRVLFEQAVELPPADRASFLAQACGEDEALRAELESLFEHGRQASDDFPQLPRALADLVEISGYRLVREIHRGGQGVVYLAIQKATRRKVAIKIMREGLFGDSKGKARFEREVRILAALRHPNILGIHDSGLAPCGHYFVMDYISGLPLDRYVREKQLGHQEVLRLFRTICEAVNTAHLKGIVHRDLKPGNILVDDSGTPYVLDFGLARVAAGDVTGDTHPQIMTTTGQFLGTLAWSSPEQAEGKSSKIDMRTDVYALGVILYQLLTGEFPYDVSGSMPEVIGNILAAPPIRPSTIRRRLGADVETIVLKALAKERERRYQAAGDLARDISHVLAGEPIEAKRASTLYVLSKSVRRHRTGVLVAAGLILVAGSAAWLGRKTAVAPTPDIVRVPSSVLDDVKTRYEVEKRRNLDERVPAGLFEKPAIPTEIDLQATLRRYLKAEPRHFCPLLDQAGVEGQVTELVFDSLFLRTSCGDFKTNPALVKGEAQWSGDHKECRLRLRPDALWHDGKPVVAEDVEFSWAAQQPKESVELGLEKDGEGLIFRFARPQAAALSSMNFLLLPKHVYGPQLDLAETGDARRQSLIQSFKGGLVGCGPYRLLSVSDDSLQPKRDVLQLERFSEYRGTMPFFENVLFRWEGAEDKRLQRFLDEEIDEFELTDEQYASWYSSKLPGYRVLFPKNQYNVVLWNIKKHPELFGDTKVRQALAHAFNLETAMTEAKLDTHHLVNSVFPVLSWAWERLPNTLGYQPEIAKRLLGDAGWKLRDGVQVADIKGQNVEFRFSIVVKENSPTSLGIMEYYANNLKQIGVLAEVEARSGADVDAMMKEKTFDAIVFGVMPGIDPALDRQWWHSGDPAARKNLTPVSCGYQNAEVDRLFDEADATLDMAKRREIYVKLQRLIYKDQPVMFLYNRPAKWALSKKLRGVEFGIRGPFGFDPGVRAWWTPKTAP